MISFIYILTVKNSFSSLLKSFSDIRKKWNIRIVNEIIVKLILPSYFVFTPKVIQLKILNFHQILTKQLNKLRVNKLALKKNDAHF